MSSSAPERSGGPPFPQGVALKGKQYVVMCGIYVVGWTDLEVAMDDGRSAAGVLEPGPHYHLVKGVFDLYRDAAPDDHSALAAYVRARDALGLTIYETSSLPLAATVQLISEWPNRRKIIHVSVTDERYWIRFRIAGGPRPESTFD
jgi:hypothetical protein